MSNDDKDTSNILSQLKAGSILVKRKINGKKFSRRFFLHELEGFISYEKSRKIFGRPRICKYKTITISTYYKIYSN